MDETLTRSIESAAKTAIEERVFPGCVVGVVRTSGERTILPFGALTYEEGAPPVREDTIYDVASVTKSIPLACLALHYINEGKLKLTDKLIQYVPEFKNSDRRAITIKHLLTYTIGSYPLSAFKDSTPEDIYQSIMTRDFTVKPGTAFLYSNLPAFLLGLVVERVGGRPIDILAREIFFTHLHMDRTDFSAKQFLSDEIAPTEVDARGEVRGVVHDESAYVFAERGGKAVGHAGLFSCAGDLLTFLEMLLNEGEFHGHLYLSADLIREMSTNQITDLNHIAGLGWQLADHSFMGAYAGDHTFGKTGFTGVSVVCDIQRAVAFAVLSNRTYPKRPQSNTAIQHFRRAIADAIFSSLEE